MKTEKKRPPAAPSDGERVALQMLAWMRYAPGRGQRSGAPEAFPPPLTFTWQHPKSREVVTVIHWHGHQRTDRGVVEVVCFQGAAIPFVEVWLHDDLAARLAADEYQAPWRASVASLLSASRGEVSP